MILTAITWSVDPELVKIGPFSIRWYGLLFATGFYLGYLIMLKIFKREKLPESLLDKLTWYMVLATVIGARLGHCLFYEPEYYLSNPFEILKIWKGGLASHGGAIGILIALYIFSKKTKKKFLWIMDRVVIPTALVGFLIRMGNLMNSEIYGHQTDLPWGFIFERRGEIVPKHPTQIYEGLAYLLLFFLLYKLYFRKPKGDVQPGLLFSIFLILLFTARFFIEFIKEVQVQAEVDMTLKLGQWLSLPFVVAGIVLLIWSFKKYGGKPQS